MSKIRVGLLTFSDGREFVHNDLVKINKDFESRLKSALEATGEIEVITAEELIWKPSVAKKEALRLNAMGVEMTVFNYAVWAFPHFSVIASKFAPGPFLLFGNINPRFPGMVGMLAAAGSLDHDGTKCKRVWGDVEEPEVLRETVAYIRASSARRRLVGMRYGLFGGRPMGMYTAVPNVDLWNSLFGVDIEHIDQYEIIRRSSEVSDERAVRAREWLEARVRRIHYDGKQLTPEKLEKQISSYYAVKDVIREEELDFIGIKAQPELTNNFVTMDVTEAFMNDPYDWDGSHEPVVCATEADSDAALTMQILKLLSRSPVLFADVRHYDEEFGVLDLCNSGSHATYFAGRSSAPEENLSKVEFYPESFYFPAGGASVRHIAAPGEVTIARLMRKDGKYWMAILPAEFVDLGNRAEEKAEASQIEWPHAFARLRVPIADFLSTYGSNHCHAVYGDYVKELVDFCRISEIDYHVYT